MSFYSLWDVFCVREVYLMSPFIQIKLANPQLRKGQGKSAVSVFSRHLGDKVMIRFRGT